MASETTATPAQSALWDDSLWDALIESIHRGRVIPITGPTLSTIETDAGRQTVERFVAEQLAPQLAMSADDLPAAFSLDDVVSAHLRRGRHLQDLYPKISSILKQRTFEAPPELAKLARITDFKLYVSTAFDSLLEAALQAARGAKVDSIGYTPSESEFCDLPSKLRQLQGPLVYHILGKVSALPEYVISDDDLLEYVFALQSDRQPERLFEELASHSLLILGGNFPDWLFRLFLRLTKRQRLSDPRRPNGDQEFLADERSLADASLVAFLSNFSRQTRVFGGTAGQFIDELSRRWQDQYGGQGAAPAPAAPVPRDLHGADLVFISYAREDLAAARALKAGLEARGFNAWMDEDRIHAGDFGHHITAALQRCAVFLPLISRNTEALRSDSYFRLEWHTAVERDLRNADSVSFIIPVIVDETPIDAVVEVPERFKRKTIIEAPAGRTTAALERALNYALGRSA